jgi:hypothetical protein
MSRKLRQLIFAYYLEHCRPPTLQEMSLLADEPEKQVSKDLQALQDAHHLVLYDKNIFSPTPISMVHPFSHLWVVESSYFPSQPHVRSSTNHLALKTNPLCCGESHV